MTQVFISYSRQDREVAVGIHSFLAARGVLVWRDEQRIRGGEQLDERIKSAITSAGFVVALLSASSLASEYVDSEIRYALELRLRGVPVTVVPILIDDSEVPELLSPTHVLRPASLTDDGLRCLIDAIRGEHVKVLDYDGLRITLVRRGGAFDLETEPSVQALAGVSSDIAFVALIQLLGDRASAAQATRFLKALTLHFFENWREILKDEDDINASVIFLRYFTIINRGLRNKLGEINAGDSVECDVALALIVEGHIFMRNAGASCGLIKQFLGMDGEQNSVWALKAMTGNVGGKLDAKQSFWGNIFAYPIGRFDEVTSAEPVVFPFSTPRSIAVLCNFKLDETKVVELGKTAVGLDGLGIARRLIEEVPDRLAHGFAPRVDGMAISIECLGDGRRLLSEAEKNAVESRGRAAADAPRPASASNSDLAKACMARGAEARSRGRNDEAFSEFENALAFYEPEGDKAGMIRALVSMVSAKIRDSLDREAISYAEQAAALSERTKDAELQLHALTGLGAVQRRIGQLDRAKDTFTRALQVSQSVHDVRVKAGLLNNVGTLHSAMGDRERALAFFRDAKRFLPAGEHPGMHALVDSNAAWELHRLGRSSEAAHLWRQSSASLRMNRLPAAEDGATLVLIQRWLEEAEGMERTDEEFQVVIEEAMRFAFAKPHEGRALLERTAGRLFTGLAEAALEEALFRRDYPQVQDRFRSALALLRRARRAGIDAAYQSTQDGDGVVEQHGTD